MRLVAAIDVHDKGEAVIAQAIPWAKRFHGTLDLLFASEWSTEGLPMPAVRSDELDALWFSWGERADEEKKKLSLLLEGVPADVRGHARILTGRPVDVLPDAVQSYDLLVVATHARTSLGRAMLGSVTHRLVRQLRTPALIVGLDDPIPDPSGRLLVLAPVDEDEPGALRWIAAHLGAERLEMVHVMQALTPTGGWLGAAQTGSMSLEPVLRKMSLEAQIHRTAASFGFTAAPTHLPARDSVNPGDAVARLAAEIGADVIVMPTHGRSGLERWFIGSVAERVMERAPCPVLVVPMTPHG